MKSVTAWGIRVVKTGRILNTVYKYRYFAKLDTRWRDDLKVVKVRITEIKKARKK